jgi:signal transduction histidine kinase
MMHADTFLSASGRQRKYLGHKIVLVVLVYTLLVASLVTGVQIYRAYQTALGNLEQRFNEIENSYLPSLAAGLWSVDVPRIDALLDGMAKIPDVGRLELRGELDDAWQRVHPAHHQALQTRDFKITYREGNDTFEMGNLHVELMAQDIQAKMWDTAKSIAITTTVSLFMSAIFVLFVFRRWIGRHLVKTAKYVQQLDLTNLDQALHLDRPSTEAQDELDLVVYAINSMRSSIQRDMKKRDLLDQELALYREQLEQLVAERTADLQSKTTLLESKSEQLILQNRELDAYAHTVAHDLKQPVSNLMGASNLLNAENLELSAEKNRMLLMSIQQSSKKMHAIIDSLLLLAKVRKDDNLPLEKISLEHAAREAFHRLTPLASERHAHIHFSGYWPAVLGHEQWVEEVWANYLSNAIKYGGDSPNIEIGATDLANGYVKCWVADSGVGLSSEQQEQLFGQFVRLHPSAADGHGLGLSIVQRIVYKLGGEVGYDKGTKFGSVFWFTLRSA